ncbi:MAG: BACON domain-containing protein, partial [Bacteroidales bacterium]|nr:BACON domain-containing protein [Bacteroidales bacterium]
MKKILLLLCSVAFMFAACSGEDVIPEVPETPNPDPVIPLTIPSTENLSPSFSPDGGTSKVSFTANVSWSAKVVEQGATWCTVSPASGGAGSHTLTISTVANDTPDSRTATVQLTAGTETKTINITQKQKDALTVTSNKFELPAEGGLVEIEAKANIEFGYIISEEGKSWISYVETKALKTSHLIFKVAESDSLAVREAKITVSGGGLSEDITVIQAAKAPAEFKISQTEVEVGSEKSTFELVITSSIGYEVKPEADWITQTAVTGSNGVYTHTFEVLENTSTDSREGIIVVCNDEQKCIPVTVKQKQKDALTVTSNKFELPAEGGLVEIEAKANIELSYTIS